MESPLAAEPPLRQPAALEPVPMRAHELPPVAAFGGAPQPGPLAPVPGPTAPPAAAPTTMEEARATTGILELPHGLGGADQPGPKYKRGRGRSFFKEQPKKGAVCQVPGCDRSLHKLRDYYKRYKICPYHLELPCLVVEGQTIRFCQQCGRFQLLTDFEGDRRSCRRKLDKHNERRRKAEAEQKARLMDSGSDSQEGSGEVRLRKAHRVSPYRPKSLGNHANHNGAGLGSYGGSELDSRLQALANDPMLQDAVAPGLLQSLADHSGMGTGMDWLAAGSLTSLALGGAAPPPPPMPPPMQLPQHPAGPVLPPDLLALLPPEVQRQVLQQGPGVLNSALLAQLQQLGQTVAAPVVAPQPVRPFGLSMFGGAAAQQGVPANAPSPLQSFNAAPPAGLMNPPALPQPLKPQPRALTASDLPRPALDGASVFLQQVAQHSARGSPAGVPLLRSDPVAAAMSAKPEPSAAAGAAPEANNDKMALLVALARSVGVSSQDLAKALVAGDFGGGLGKEIAAAGGGHATAAPAPLSGHPSGGSPTAPMHNHNQQQQQQQQQQQASDSLAPMNSGGGSQAMDASQPGSSAAANSSPSQAQPQRPGSVFKPPAMLASSFVAPMGPPNGAAVQQQQLVASAASAALPTSAAGPALLDLGQLQNAVQHSGLNPGFATDANLLLQLIAAAEKAQREAGAGNDRIHSLSLKLFNCTPDRLPKNILDQLEEWMVQNKTLLDGAARPGCMQLSVSALMSGAEFEALSSSFASMVQRLACGGLSGVQTSVLAQLDGRAALVDSGKQQLMRLELGDSGAATPEILSVRPLAVTPAYAGPVLVTGRNMGGPQDAVFCRNGDHFPTTEVFGCGPLLSTADGRGSDTQWTLLRFPALEEGCHLVEAQRGIFVSTPAAFLVIEDEAAAAELRQLEAVDSTLPSSDTTELLTRLGAVLRFGRGLRDACPADVARVDAALLARVAAAAQDLVAACVLRGWPAVLRLLLPVACCGGVAPEAALAGIEQHLSGMPLLHAAALIGSGGIIKAVGAWAAGAGLSLRLDACWGGGLTAFHVAALLREPEEVAVALTELEPADACTLWCAAAAEHGGETPLGLACRQNKRALLGTLAQHGVPAAGAMLSALQLQDGMHGAAGTPPPVGVKDAAEELTQQRRQWTKLYGSAVLSQQGGGEAEQQGSRSWPHTKLTANGCGAPVVPLSAGQKSPSSVLSSLAACCDDDGMPLDSAGSGGSTLEGSAAAADAGTPRCGKAQLLCGDKANAFCLPFKPDATAAASLGPGSAQQEKGAGMVWSFGDSTTEHRFRRWHAAKLSTMDTLVFCFTCLLLCSLLAVAPTLMRQQLHMWLLTSVARAPLMLQPLVLLCPPAHTAYRRCRGSVLLGLHVATFGLQWWALRTRGAEWLSSAAALSHPSSLWLLIAVFSLQMRFAVQVPAALLMYAANVLLLPFACRAHPHAASALSHDTSCVVVGGVRLFVIGVVLPAMATWLLEARARFTFATLFRPRRAPAAPSHRGVSLRTSPPMSPMEQGPMLGDSEEVVHAAFVLSPAPLNSATSSEQAGAGAAQLDTASFDDGAAAGLRRRLARHRADSSSSGGGSPEGHADVASAGVLAPVHPWSLTFRDAALEAEFAAHYARSMWRIDLAAMLSHAVFYCLLLFAPGPLGMLAWKLPLTTQLRGFSYLPWLPVLLLPPLRRWYLRWRDACLVALMVNMAGYMISVRNHQPWVDPAFATHPMFFHGGLSWISFTLVFFQPRLLYHRGAATLLAAAQLPALRHFCWEHYGAAPALCMARGCVKLVLLAALPLAAVAWVEVRARRIFLRLYLERQT